MIISLAPKAAVMRQMTVVPMGCYTMLGESDKQERRIEKELQKFREETHCLCGRISGAARAEL